MPPGRRLRNGTNTTIDTAIPGFVEVDARPSMVVAQPDPPADTHVLWLDTDDQDIVYATQDELDALVISGGGISIASEAEALAGTDNTKAMTPARVALVAPKLAGDNTFTGKQEINGGGFTQGFDADLWIAGNVRTAPGTATQGIYVQHRVNGDGSASVHDATASELRLGGVSNTTGLNAHEASLVVSTGEATISDTRAITANMHTSGTPSGTITNLSLLRAQTVPALLGTLAITNLYGVYIEANTVATNNWGLYVAGGSAQSRIEGSLTVLKLALGSNTANQADTLAVNGVAGSNRQIVLQSGGVSRWIIQATSTAEGGSNAGSDLAILARTDAGGSNVTAVSITRSSGLVTLAHGLQFNTANGYIEMTERASDISAPAANVGRLYLKDNGAGKTQLCVRFATGAVQVIATEP